MRIGLVTDIHDHVEPLARALEQFRRCGVDLVVTLGDSIDAFTRESQAAEVVALLRGANAVGVWGNHDMGLCFGVDDRTRGRYPAAVLDCMATMRPSLVVGDCHFSHVGPSVDAYDVQAMWRFGEGPPDFTALARRSFVAVAQRLVFVGHHHRWLAVTAGGPLDWRGEGPLSLAGPERHFVVMGAIFQGQCGVLDTERCELCPLPC